MPVLNIDTIFLKKDETCHYVDKAIYEKKVVRKRYVRRSGGTIFKGIISKNFRHWVGGGVTDVVDNTQYERVRGILYITNKRVVFQGEHDGLSLKTSELAAIRSYTNGVELQGEKGNYKFFVPCGALVHTVLQLIQ